MNAHQPGTSPSLEDRLAAIPRVEALEAEMGIVDRIRARLRSGLRDQVSAWTPRHTYLTFLTVPAFYLAFGNSVGTLLPADRLVLVSLVVASVLGGLYAATHLPAPGEKAKAPKPCVGGSLFPVVMALFVFQDALQTPALAAFSAVLVAVGLAQRVYGAEACAA